MTSLAICGDPIVSRILVMLLQDSGYDMRFLYTSSLNEPGVLKGVRLLLLAPTPQLSSESRKALLASLKEIQEAEEFIVLELDISLEERRDEAPEGSWHMVPWPCRLEELKRRIEAAMPTNSTPRADLATKSHRLEDKKDDA